MERDKLLVSIEERVADVVFRRETVSAVKESVVESTFVEENDEDTLDENVAFLEAVSIDKVDELLTERVVVPSDVIEFVVVNDWESDVEVVARVLSRV